MAERNPAQGRRAHGAGRHGGRAGPRVPALRDHRAARGAPGQGLHGPRAGLHAARGAGGGGAGAPARLLCPGGVLAASWQAGGVRWGGPSAPWVLGKTDCDWCGVWMWAMLLSRPLPEETPGTAGAATARRLLQRIHACTGGASRTSRPPTPQLLGRRTYPAGQLDSLAWLSSTGLPPRPGRTRACARAGRGARRAGRRHGGRPARGGGRGAAPGQGFRARPHAWPPRRPGAVLQARCMRSRACVRASGWASSRGPWHRLA